jgi:NAD(P) transhydrogenase subunit alpha
MKVSVLRESRPGEHRVALVPDVVRELVDKHGLQVVVEQGAGEGSHISDDEFMAAGGTVAGREAVLAAADVVLKVAPPTIDEVRALPEGSVLIGFLSPFNELRVIEALAQRRVTTFSMELVPRTTRAQRMDALSSQANLAGYKAVLLAAERLGRILPMFMTAAGTIRPGKALILGAGVAGLQAIATARRLGARVEAFDVRPAVKEQVQSLGATFLEADDEVAAEGEGGYASELSAEQHERELAVIGAHIHDADIVISTAQIPGRRAPVLITEEMVRSMRSGSVIVDMAASTGGNCELSKPDEEVVAHGVHIIGPSNLPAEVPVHASQLYARNVATLLLEMVSTEPVAAEASSDTIEAPALESRLDIDLDNDVLGPSCLTHGGRITHDATAQRVAGLENDE